jgi:hypothetical protein
VLVESEAPVFEEARNRMNSTHRWDPDDERSGQLWQAARSAGMPSWKLTVVGFDQVGTDTTRDGDTGVRNIYDGPGETQRFEGDIKNGLDVASVEADVIQVNGDIEGGLRF